MVSDDQSKEKVWEYWLRYVPNLSWNSLAGKLYSMGEKVALQAAMQYVTTPEGTLMSSIILYLFCTHFHVLQPCMLMVLVII